MMQKETDTGTAGRESLFTDCGREDTIIYGRNRKKKKVKVLIFKAKIRRICVDI